MSVKAMFMERNSVVLVDEKDVALGTMDKLAAHKEGKLHRAFSVFIFNDSGQLLLQKRAAHKYHGGGLWTNTCCSHPQWGEDVVLSAAERLRYEMALDCDLKDVYAFRYCATVENGLIEHEYDHVLVGFSNTTPIPNTEEVSDYRWASPEEILQDIADRPSDFTVWFKEALPEVLRILQGDVR